jgi:hypothetical protein
VNHPEGHITWSPRSASVYGVVADDPHGADLVSRHLAARRRIAA